GRRGEGDDDVRLGATFVAQLDVRAPADVVDSDGAPNDGNDDRRHDRRLALRTGNRRDHHQEHESHRLWTNARHERFQTKCGRSTRVPTTSIFCSVESESRLRIAVSGSFFNLPRTVA